VPAVARLATCEKSIFELVTHEMGVDGEVCRYDR
jgi:hypothetical protein